jgi:lysophospholipase L1-like esterase
MDRARTRTMAVVAVAAVVAVVLVMAGGTQSSPGHPYLALGDSVTFGYITQAGFEYQNPDNFIGYPTYVGDALGMTPTNPACPGETTAGFISATGADNGCRPFKANFPLHTGYHGTQLAFAVAFLNSHPNTKLVTILLGANDGFLLQKQCGGDPTCIGAGVPSLLATVRGNLDGILGAIQASHFHGKLVVLNYYSLDYSDPLGTGFTQALNGAIAGAAHAHGAIVADEFSAFAAAAASAGGKTCAAGLLNTTPGNQATCDVHPSQSGQQLLGRTVAAAFDNR